MSVQVVSGGGGGRRPFFRRRKSCPFSGPKAPKIDYKDTRLLQRFVRSEEHTSELQSLMRSSYAVFCLKKKKQHITKNNKTHYTPPKHVDDLTIEEYTQ